MYFVDIEKGVFKTKLKSRLKKIRKQYIIFLLNIDIEKEEIKTNIKLTNLLKKAVLLEKNVLFEMKCKVNYQENQIYIYYGNQFTIIYTKPSLKVAIQDMVYNKMLNNAKYLKKYKKKYCDILQWVYGWKMIE